MQLETGSILEGKVTGITKFGAFVELPGGRTGMVHISEIAATYVKEIRDFVTENQMVKVKILNIGEDGKISLSMKRAVDNPPPQHQKRRQGPRTDSFEWNSNRRGGQSGEKMSFEDMHPFFTVFRFKSLSGTQSPHDPCGRHPQNQGWCTVCGPTHYPVQN